MRFRNFSLAMCTATLLTLSFLAPDLHAGKKNTTKSKEEGAAASTAWPQIPDLDFITRLRQEEFNYSQAMDLMGHLTDNIGPRLTGSPNMKKANDWTRDEFAQWGMANSHLEAWGPFGRGWDYQLCEVRMTSPDHMQFIALPEAWTPGTNGPLRGQIVRVQATSAADFEKYRGKLAGKIVLFGDARLPPPDDKPYFDRATEAELDKIVQYEPGGPPNQRNPDMVKRYKFVADTIKFFTDERVAAVLDITRDPGENGVIQLQAGGPYEKDKTIDFPRVALSVEHFGRVARLLEKNIPVEVELNVETRFYDDDPMCYNTIAEIPGVDPNLKDQLVMLGGHLDSWHGSEGATDNGAGTIVAMEAVRLLEKLGVQPRRTIRVALWSGEEQGELGSRDYVADHFGSLAESTDPLDQILPIWLRPTVGPPQLKPDQKLVSAYFNLDNGPGKIRGVFLQENAAARPVFEKWMEPLRDLGMTTLTMRNTGSTDHISFDDVGIPGFEFLQDGMDYGVTHHSNVDSYEHIRPDDLKQAAIVMATFVYNAAMVDEMIPRKPLRPEDPPATK
jgi:carboxypeptidase Q